MMLLHLLLSTAMASPEMLAIAIGAEREWSDLCVQNQRWKPEDPTCGAQSNRLSYTSLDAWRMAYLYQASAKPENILLFTAREDLPDLGAFHRAGDARMASIAAGIRAHVSAMDPTARARLSLDIYVSSHGQEGGFHLDDRFVTRAEFLAEIDAATGGAPVRVLLADACDSAGSAQRGQAIVNEYPRWERQSRDVGFLEVSAYDSTVELPAIQGGGLSYALRPALLGAADSDGDGVTRPEEMMHYLSSHRPELGGYYPVVRAHEMDQNLEPRPSASAALLVAEPPENLPEPTPDAMRWVLLAPGDGLSPAVVLLDFVVESSAPPPSLTIPAGEYVLILTPYHSLGQTDLYFPRFPDDSGESFAGFRCSLLLNEGQTWRGASCEDLTDVRANEHLPRLDNTLQSALSRGASMSVPPLPGDIPAIQPLREAPKQPFFYGDPYRFPSGRTLELGPQFGQLRLPSNAGTPATAMVFVGVDARVSEVPTTRRLSQHMGVALAVSALPSTETLMLGAELRRGADLPLASAERLQLGLSGSATAGGILLWAPAYDSPNAQFSPLLGLRLGPSLESSGTGGAAHFSLQWAPSWAPTRGPSGNTVVRSWPGRVVCTVSLRRNVTSGSSS